MSQAFVYKWTHIPTGKWYIGSRTAKDCHPNDGYICSSTIVKPMIEQNPEEWKRTILHTGAPKEMRRMETHLLLEANAKDNPMSFNRNNAIKPNTKKKRYHMPKEEDKSLVNNQKIKKTSTGAGSGRGGVRANSGRKPGAIQKLGGKDLLIAIAKATGKTFEDNIAEHYNRAIMSGDWHDVRDYEKFIISKVISDVKEIDVTSNGQTVGVAFSFPTIELQDWSSGSKKID